MRPLDAVAAGEEHSADEKKRKVNIINFICTEDSCLRRRSAVAAGEEYSADEKKNGVHGDEP
jgi:hypothetical protein